ncbi:hypothetical protein [Zeaxanthinibacter enoshimensis]|uniref:hypothetical protein n=1 Tax=Zeaxanthinibacter enoshimensis TaxID=392009 RepID=UPI003566CB51
MRSLSVFLSYLFHPLLIPMAGTLSYFLVTPKYSPLEEQGGNLLPIFILTIVIPVITFLILRNLGLASSVFLTPSRERFYPLLISIGLLMMVLFKVIPNNYTAELYYYFVGLIAATAACLLALILKVRCSLHMMGLGSLLMYLIALSIHFEINITIAISVCTLICGLAASARIYLKAHNKAEIAIGFMIGFLSQLMTIKYWL